MDKHDDLIFDVGLHRGEDTDYYLKKGFRVVAFEADPASVDHCRAHFSEALASGNLTIVAGAIVDPKDLRSGQKVSFYRNLDDAAWGTVSEGFAARNERLGTRSEVIEVDAVDFAKCLRTFGIPRYMKLDIEGAETNCLGVLADASAKPDYLSLESEKRVFGSLKAEVALLERLGYNRFQAVGQLSVMDQVQPNPVREGIYAPNHSFQRGSSGLFGRELPDAWKTSAELVAEYRRIFRRYRLFGDFGPFGDASPLRRYRLGQAISLRVALAFRRPGEKSVVQWYDTHAKHSSIRD